MIVWRLNYCPSVLLYQPSKHTPTVKIQYRRNLYIFQSLRDDGARKLSQNQIVLVRSGLPLIVIVARLVKVTEYGLIVLPGLEHCWFIGLSVYPLALDISDISPFALLCSSLLGLTYQAATNDEWNYSLESILRGQLPIDFSKLGQHLSFLIKISWPRWVCRIYLQGGLTL